MALQEGIETLICSHCGAHHGAKWHRLPVREEQSVHCKACRQPLVMGKGIRDYFDVELTEP